jgi:hypothetical protein
MSDEFACCDSCGEYDAYASSIILLKFELAQKIFELCVSLRNENFKQEIEPKLAEMLSEYSLLVFEESKGNDYLCNYCNQYTTMSWDFVDYKNSSSSKEIED